MKRMQYNGGIFIIIIYFMHYLGTMTNVFTFNFFLFYFKM